jgi:hypothetical protein
MCVELVMWLKWYSHSLVTMGPQLKPQNPPAKKKCLSDCNWVHE